MEAMEGLRPFTVFSYSLRLKYENDYPDCRTAQRTRVNHRKMPIPVHPGSFWFILGAAHKAASPTGASPVMVNDDDPSSHNRRGKGRPDL
jgi:hypothetical protein